MKKILALILAMLMIVVLFAGCNNKKTYYTDKEHFALTLYPNSADGKVFANGINSIQIVMNTPNVVSGTGEIALYEKDTDREIFRYDVRMDAKLFLINQTKSPAVTQIIILLPEGEAFESGKTYYVTMDPDCFYIDDIKGNTGEVKKGEWEFTIADYGIDGRINDIPVIYLKDSVITVPVKLSGDAVSAVLLYDNLSVVSSDVRELRQTGKFELDAIGEGSSVISIMFLDKDGKLLETLGFTVTVK